MPPTAESNKAQEKTEQQGKDTGDLEMYQFDFTLVALGTRVFPQSKLIKFYILNKCSFQNKNSPP